MISSTGRRKIEDSLRNFSIIWAATLALIIVIIAVTGVMFKNGSLPLPSGMDEATQTILLAVLSALAASEIGGIVLFSVLFKSESVIKKRLLAVPPDHVEPNPSGAQLTEDDRLATALAPLYLSLCVIRWTLGFSVSLYGFILALVTGFMDVGAVFYGISFLVVAYLRPGTGEIEEMAAKAGTYQ
jgi:hypothetical protein